MGNPNSHNDLLKFYGMDNWQPNAPTASTGDTTRPAAGLDGSIPVVAQRVQAAHQTQESLRQRTANASTRERGIAREAVYEAIGQLIEVSEPEAGIEVFEEASIAERSLRAFYKKRSSDKAPFTISEYKYGENNPETIQTQFTVARRASGWLLPRLITLPEPSRTTGLAVYAPDIAVPHASSLPNLAISTDYESWQDAHIAGGDGSRLTVGVRKDDAAVDRVLDRYSPRTLHKVEEALQYMSENPIFPKESPSGGRHRAPEE